MAKKRLVAIVVSAFLVLTAVAGASYAWFSSSAGNISGSGKAAYINLEEGPAHQLIFKNVLPGEEVDFGLNTLFYAGNRDALLQFTLSAEGRFLEAAEDHEDWQALNPLVISGSYVKDGVTYKYTEQRLNEIMKVIVNMPGTVQGLHKGRHVPNSYYLWVKASESGQVDLAKLLKIKFTGEFGGLFDDGSGNRSPSRQFEQESKFDVIGLNVRAVQVTENAVKDVWGAKALLDVKEMATFPQFSLLDEWTYIG